MKRIMLFSVLFIAAFSIYAQDGIGWNIVHNKKTIFSAREENEEKNSIVLTGSDFKSTSNFVISYTEKNTGRKANSWIRSFGIYTETDKELFRKQSSKLKIPDAQLKKILLENKMVKIYTWAIPKDPKEAARVRVRRVHLCTVILK